MSRLFEVTFRIDMPDDQTEADAKTWGASVCDAHLKPRCRGCDGRGRVRSSIGGGIDHDWLFCEACQGTGKYGEHPYKPQCVGAVEVAHPLPRRR